MNIKYVLILATTIAALGLLAGCDNTNAETHAAPPPPDVSVAEVLSRNIRQWDEFNGRVEAVESVEIRPRVAGRIDAVRYDEGQEVRKDQVLFIIDPRPYRAALDLAEAALTQAHSQRDLARSEMTRVRKLIDANMISQEEYDKRVAAADQGEARIRAATAAVDLARLNLDFTEVRSPIDGRAGRAMVTAGNLVSPEDQGSLLTTVVSLNPVHVYFEGDEQTYLRYVSMTQRGERPSARDVPLPVRVGLVNEQGFPHPGLMDFVDNQLDPETGTIHARAVVDNSDRSFTPGLFARVQLLGGDNVPVLLVDDKAILTDQDRKYLYILGPDNQALRREVETGRLADGLRVITSGLAGDEQVIVHGIQKVYYPGMTVNPQAIDMGAMPGSATAAATLNETSTDVTSEPLS